MYDTSKRPDIGINANTIRACSKSICLEAVYDRKMSDRAKLSCFTDSFPEAWYTYAKWVVEVDLREVLARVGPINIDRPPRVRSALHLESYVELFWHGCKLAMSLGLNSRLLQLLKDLDQATL